MLPNTLNTNEVKNSAGTEQEFQRLAQNAQSTEFGLITEAPYTPHRLKIAHSVTGSGVNLRRRSLIRVDKTTVSGVDSTKTITTSAYIVVDLPSGLSANNDEVKNVIANLLSFCATTGAGTTVLFDGSGNGAQALITGGL